MTDDGLFYDPDLDEYTYLGTEKHGSTPGALQGDDDGYPKLPACLDRRAT